MEIKARIAFVFCLLVGFSSSAVAESETESLLWQDIKPLVGKSARSNTKPNTEFNNKYKNKKLVSVPEMAYQKARILHLDIAEMAARLNTKILAGKGLKAINTKASSNPKMIDLPLPDGRFITVSIRENTLLPAKLRRYFPNMKMLNILPDNFIVSGKLDLTINGFHAMLQTREGKTVFIDPVSNTNTYASYQKSDQQAKDSIGFSCSAHSEVKLEGNEINFSPVSRLKYSSAIQKTGQIESRTNKSLINYRIAIAATGEYTAKHGGTVAGAMAAIATTINRVNQVFEQDLGIHLSLVENNDQLIYLDANSDPYSGTDSKELLYQNQNNIDAVIGSNNYDIGHLFSTTGGGLAAIASACNRSRKSQGISGINNPRNDSFNLDFVAHEIGHQFGATHTFNGTQGLCSGNTRSASTAFEPGSGSTIMSYAGYCGGDNLQSNTDAMFHIGSIQQIRAYVESEGNKGCGIDKNISNASPQVNAGVNHVIPAQTPFELTGKAIDADNDELIYSWQQIDAGDLSSVNLDTGNNAIFRTHPLSHSEVRSFPPLQNLLNHTQIRGETLPVQERYLKFKLAVQDSHNTTQSDVMSIYVKRTGSRFALNLPRSQYSVGEAHKILWNVAGTDVAPINCSSVDISLSIDGGYHFNKVLGEGIPNTGEAWVIIPATVPSTSQGRFKIRCSDNIFFAVSYRNFEVNKLNHSNRLILSDEDQPENNLKDIDISKIETTKYAEPSSSVAGGALGGLFALLFLLSIRKFKNIENKSLSDE